VFTITPARCSPTSGNPRVTSRADSLTPVPCPLTPDPCPLTPDP